MLAVHAVLGFDVARIDTVTHDEYLHLPCGLLTATTGRFNFDHGTPPLLRTLAALPLLFTSAVPPPNQVGLGWEYGDRFFESNAANFDTYLTLARAMIVLLSVGAGVVLGLWARAMFGAASGLLAVLVWSVCPTVLGHAPLVTADLGAAAMYLFTLFAVWMHARRPTWTRAFAFGLILGMAQLAKFTAVLLVPLSAILWIAYRAGNREVESPGWKKCALQSASAYLIALVVLNAGYLFQETCAPLGSFRFKSQSLQDLGRRIPWASRLPVPLPRDYLVGFDIQRSVMEGQHPVFLDGEWTTEGFPQYYAKALWYKEPHAEQLLFALACLFLLVPRTKSRLLREQAFLMVPAAVLIAVASGMRMQLGIRYILPAFPMLILFAGQAARWVDWRRMRLRSLAVLLCSLALPISLRHHPHHLAYFNELAGGPSGGREHLVDSNLDWGQDLRALKDWLDKNPVTDLRLAYFGMLPPARLGISYTLPPARSPEPGWYAVSVNFVAGRPHSLRDAGGDYHPVGLDDFGYFRFFTTSRAATIGYSIDVYHLSPLDVARWRAAISAMQRQGQNSRRDRL